MASEYFGSGVVLTATTYEGRLDYSYTTTATAVTITAKSTCRSTAKNYGRMEGVCVQINGSWAAMVWHAAAIVNNGMQDRVSQSKTVTIQRTSVAQSIPLRAEYGVGDAYGGYNYDGSGKYQSPIRYVTVPALDPPTTPGNFGHVRTSDTQNTLSWTTPNNADNVLIERSIDGGSWAQIASVAASATSYTDSSAQANHYYSYRVRAAKGSQYSAYSGQSAYTYNTPAAPGTPSAWRSSDAAVSLSWSNPAITETATQVQRSTNGSSWADIATINAANAVTYTDSPGGGTFYYRVRNMRGSLASAWSAASPAVTTIMAPAAPALLTPASGAIVSVGDVVRLSWKHNPLDGSPQTAARIYIYPGVLPGEGFPIYPQAPDQQAINISGATSYYDTAFDSTWVNRSVEWYVQTKGSHADFGSVSASRSFTIMTPPSVVITEPAQDGWTLSSLPLLIAWDCSDQSGSQNGATIRILKDGVASYHKEIIGDQSSYVIESSEFLPENNSSYTIEIKVTSSSSLGAMAVRQIDVDYIPPEPPLADITIDDSLASVGIVLRADQSDDPDIPETVSLGLFRIVDDRQIMLLDQVDDGSAFVDRWPPLDKEFAYMVVAYSASGVFSTTSYLVTVNSKGAYLFNFGDGFTRVSKLMFNLDYSKAKEHDRRLFKTAGAKHPLAFYGTNETNSGRISGVAITKDHDLDAATPEDIESLSDHTGSVILRMPGKVAVRADVNVQTSHISPGILGVSISWEQVRGDGLDIE